MWYSTLSDNVLVCMCCFFPSKAVDALRVSHECWGDWGRPPSALCGTAFGVSTVFDGVTSTYANEVIALSSDGAGSLSIELQVRATTPSR